MVRNLLLGCVAAAAAQQWASQSDFLVLNETVYAFIALDNARDGENATDVNTAVAALRLDLDSFIALDNARDGENATTVADLEAKLDAFIALDNARDGENATDVNAELAALRQDLDAFIALDNARDGENATTVADLEAKLDAFIALDNARDGDEPTREELSALEKKVNDFIVLDNERDAPDASARVSGIDPFTFAKLQFDVQRNSEQLATDHDEDDEVADKVRQLELELAGYRDFEDLAIAGLVLGSLGFLMGLMGLGLGLSSRYSAPRMYQRHVELKNKEYAPQVSSTSAVPDRV